MKNNGFEFVPCSRKLYAEFEDEGEIHKLPVIGFSINHNFEEDFSVELLVVNDTGEVFECGQVCNLIGFYEI